MELKKYFGTESPKKIKTKIFELLENEKAFNDFFNAYIKTGQDLSKDSFSDFFEMELSERKTKKQDFTPHGLALLAYDFLGDFKEVYDPCAGTGALLCKAMTESKQVHANELDEDAYNFLILNAMIRNAKTETITNFNMFENMKTYERIILNYPFSQKVETTKEITITKSLNIENKMSKGDWLFITKALDNLKENGEMVVIAPHGVLFRGGKESVIRKEIIKRGLLKTVIGLPEGLFFGAKIPVCILIFKKDNKQDEKILFIDSSKEYEKGKNQNFLTAENRKKILDTVKKREIKEKYSQLVDYKEIQENDYNLNIPRYVDTFEPEKEIDLKKVYAEIQKTNIEIKKAEAELLEMIGQLNGDTSFMYF